MKGRVIKYEQDNIDTDVILPGQYLKLHDHAELGEHAMEGMDPDFHSKAKEANIIVTGKNFGCGSSREHAPIAISACGIRMNWRLIQVKMKSKISQRMKNIL